MSPTVGPAPTRGHGVRPHKEETTQVARQPISPTRQVDLTAERHNGHDAVRDGYARDQNARLHL